MKIQLRIALPPASILAIFLLAATVEAAKPDGKSLLSHSPWAVQVRATMNDPADVPEISKEVPRTISQAGQPNVGNGNLDLNTRWDGQVSKNRTGRLATIPILVRWDSSTTIRQALEARQEPNTSELAAVSAKSVVLTVIGLLPAGITASKPGAHDLQSSSDPNPQQIKSKEETLEWFMANSLLVIKGSPAMRPQNAQVDPGTGTVHLVFQRSDKLMTNKHEIEFVTRYGSMNVQAKFRPQDMRVSGHPDL